MYLCSLVLLYNIECLNSTGQHGHLKSISDLETSEMKMIISDRPRPISLKSTCDEGPSYEWHGSFGDRGQCHLMNSTCDMGNFPSRAPMIVMRYIPFLNHCYNHLLQSFSTFIDQLNVLIWQHMKGQCISW